MRTFVLTYNPALPSPPYAWDADRELVQAGAIVARSWSTGSRRDIDVGDRVVLLRQGPDQPRGILARGTVSEPLFEDEHWSGNGGMATYVGVHWDGITPLDSPLPLDVLEDVIPEVHWNRLQSGGARVPEEAVDRLEELWTAHLGDRGGRTADGGQGHVRDAERRKSIEDHAQAMLTEHFTREGWRVTDARLSNPYDAVAERAGEKLYLEAKGTTGTGAAVLVTAGEVAWARTHPDQCVMGIVTGIVMAKNIVDPRSGDLTVLPWNPDTGSLLAVQYQWRPEPEALL